MQNQPVAIEETDETKRSSSHPSENNGIFKIFHINFNLNIVVQKSKVYDKSRNSSLHLSQTLFNIFDFMTKK